MQSIFEVKNALYFDKDVFDKMNETASALLCKAEKEQYTQAIILLSEQGKEYSAIVSNALSKDKADEKSLLNTLANDTKIDRILCVWSDGSVDIPSFTFREMLLDANEKNTDSGIFVKTADGFSVIKLGNTLK